jgi:hypothetical protein
MERGGIRESSIPDCVLRTSSGPRLLQEDAVMNDAKTRISDMLDDLKRQRDELRLKYELAKLEANEEWIKLEKKLVKLEAKAHELGKATADSSHDIAAAARLLGEEIAEGFKNVAKHF